MTSKEAVPTIGVSRTVKRPNPSGSNGSPLQILIVDDDPDARWLAVDALTEHGFGVLEAGSGRDAQREIENKRVDLVVLDLGLPGIGGLEILKAIRAVGDLPVIVVTGRGGPSDRIVGLELGADDYMVKPFDPRELVARVNTVLRRARSKPETATTLDFGLLVIDLRSRDVTRAGQPIELTAKEFDLLAFLASSPRQVFSREQILSKVWDSSPDWQNPTTVNEHIHRLRRKVEFDPSKPRWLGTMRGAGYRFTP